MCGGAQGSMGGSQMPQAGMPQTGGMNQFMAKPGMPGNTMQGSNFTLPPMDQFQPKPGMPYLPPTDHFPPLPSGPVASLPPPDHFPALPQGPQMGQPRMSHPFTSGIRNWMPRPPMQQQPQMTPDQWQAQNAQLLRPQQVQDPATMAQQNPLSRFWR